LTRPIARRLRHCGSLLRAGRTSIQARFSTSAERTSRARDALQHRVFPRSPRVEYSAKLARALLSEIAKVCREHGADLVVFYHDRALPEVPDEPTQFSVPGQCVTLSGASARALVEEVLSPSQTLVVRGVPEGATVSRRDPHLNAAGTKYVMDELARWLATRGVGGLRMPRD